MNASGDDTDTTPPSGISEWRWRYFSEEEKGIIKERRRIYEEEKRSIELEQKRSAPLFSKQTLIVAGVYLLGCVLIYSGIPQSLLDWCGTGQWKYQPETEFFYVLVGSAVQLIRPFLAAWMIGFVIAVPVMFAWFLWVSFKSFIKRLFHRDHE